MAKVCNAPAHLFFRHQCKRKYSTPTFPVADKQRLSAYESDVNLRTQIYKEPFGSSRKKKYFYKHWFATGIQALWSVCVYSELQIKGGFDWCVPKERHERACRYRYHPNKFVLCAINGAHICQPCAFGFRPQYLQHPFSFVHVHTRVQQRLFPCGR